MANQWHNMSRGTAAGPVSSEELRRLAALGKTGPEDHVRRDDGSTCMPAREVRGLFASAPPSSIRSGSQPSGASPTRSGSGPLKWIVLPLLRCVAVAIVVTLVPLLGGCKRPADSPAALLEKDPLASYKSFCSRLVESIQEVGNRGGKKKIEVSPNYNVGLDKTDSLVSPYVGTLTIAVRGCFNEAKGEWVMVPESPVECKLTFAKQNGRWELTKYDVPSFSPGRLTSPDLIVRRFNTETFMKFGEGKPIIDEALAATANP